MKRVAIGMLIIVAMIGTCLYFNRSTARAASDGPAYTQDGRLILPTGHRKWVFIGAPLTPNGLNGGKAGFPEYHHVYVQEKNLEAYQRDGVFPEGTVIVKELVLLKEADYPDGSSDSPSGRGLEPESLMAWMSLSRTASVTPKRTGGASTILGTTRFHMRQLAKRPPRRSVLLVTERAPLKLT